MWENLMQNIVAFFLKILKVYSNYFIRVSPRSLLWKEHHKVFPYFEAAIHIFRVNIPTVTRKKNNVYAFPCSDLSSRAIFRLERFTTFLFPKSTVSFTVCSSLISTHDGTHLPKGWIGAVCGQVFRRSPAHQRPAASSGARPSAWILRDSTPVTSVES